MDCVSLAANAEQAGYSLGRRRPDQGRRISRELPDLRGTITVSGVVVRHTRRDVEDTAAEWIDNPNPAHLSPHVAFVAATVHQAVPLTPASQTAVPALALSTQPENPDPRVEGVPKAAVSSEAAGGFVTSAVAHGSFAGWTWSVLGWVVAVPAAAADPKPTTSAAAPQA